MATRITFRAVCSFESDSSPVRMLRTEIVAPTLKKAASRALTEARQKFAGSRPKSVCLVLEEISRGTVPGKKRGN